MLWAVFFTFGISLPPILSVGSQEMKYVSDMLRHFPCFCVLPIR
jgi:hypothetical protein